MSKNQINIKKTIISKIKKGEIKMKPKCYFWLGSLALFFSLVASSVLSIFLISLITFSLRNRGGLMAQIRYQQLIANFPWWAVIVAILGLILAIVLLKKYDFSYKKNFFAIVIVFILAIVSAGILIDLLGFDNLWIKKGRMRKFYQRYQYPYRQYRNLR